MTLVLGFNDLRHSQAPTMLVGAHFQGLLTGDEFPALISAKGSAIEMLPDAE